PILGQISPTRSRTPAARTRFGAAGTTPTGKPNAAQGGPA
ncbi:21517_t:CDS:1, partial [Dentiscutata erythropus]